MRERERERERGREGERERERGKNRVIRGELIFGGTILLEKFFSKNLWVLHSNFVPPLLYCRLSPCPNPDQSALYHTL